MKTLTILLLAAVVTTAAAQDDALTVLTGATVHPVDGEPIDNGVVIIRGERIEAIGPSGELTGTFDGERVTVIELDGKHVYPGFVHPLSSVGLTEIGSVAGTVDTTEMGAINAALRTEVAFNPDSALLPVSVAGGILTTHTAPSGGLIRGQSAVMRMDGWSWEDMTLEAPAGMHIAFPPGAADNADNEDLATIERTLEQARHWHRAQAAFEAGNAPRPRHNAQLEALGPVLDGTIPLFLHADNRAAIDAALDWAEQQDFGRVVLVGGPDLQYVADRLAADGIPVVLNGVYTMPTRRWEAYDMAYVAAAKLNEAGVKFAIGDGGGGFGATNARNLPFQAGSAAAFGLPKDAALKSVTQWAAEIVGVGDQLGTLTAGKRASLIVTNGDPLEPMTSIERVWIDGREYDLDRSRHRQLYERYRDRIAETAPGADD
ncbi:amidohydrolase family protein [Wenzhouxiangella sp. XN79A]|uniref:amidohydrolase family protein n=1 Tax=Wenzhouxiangella sp. XN79A TaxID=2724193 RepID=UPI00144ABDCA|nr:amidohydrolase family protein [Wenzhouxiangella sp. XN79A]NKI35312.1 amidohydrolase family protein [Wenzhouxiangella sp. XN79A]